MRQEQDALSDSLVKQLNLWLMIFCSFEAALGNVDEAAILAAMQALRLAVDGLEKKVSDARWPLPKYRDMLFLY